jgi:hypothetical protein
MKAEGFALLWRDDGGPWPDYSRMEIRPVGRRLAGAAPVEASRRETKPPPGRLWTGRRAASVATAGVARRRKGK